MKKIQITLGLLFCTLLSFGQLSEADFEGILNQAQKKVSATNYEMTTFTGFKPIKYFRKTGQGTWELGLNSWGPNNTTSTQDLLSTVAIVTLDEGGQGYSFISATQSVDNEVLEKVQDYKYVKVAQKWLVKQMNYATLNFEWQDNRHVTRASSPLDGKAKKVEEDLTNIINVSRGMQNTIALAAKKYK